MDQLFINILNGVSSGLLLFMLSSGLTLIFSMMGVLNFAHASFYMVGAYFAYAITGIVGFWPALLVAPLAVGVLGAVFERTALPMCWINAFERYGFYWLGRDPQLRDTMHFEYLADPDELAPRAKPTSSASRTASR